MWVSLLFLLSALHLVDSEQCDPSECSGMNGRCPEYRGLVSRPFKTSVPVKEHVYFRNAAPWPAEISYVDSSGVEETRGVLPPGMRRALNTLHGDVWRARAVTDGPANGRLLMEHRIGPVKIRACDCPQPEFNDCSTGPIYRTPGYIYDPIMFENGAGEPVDLFYWNGTCEQLVSWNLVGGLQPAQRTAPLLSTQGHTFRLRSAASRTLLMAHTLDDLVIRGCSDEEHAALRAEDGLEALRAETAHFETEQSRLREALRRELAELVLALGASNASASLARRWGAPPSDAALDQLPLAPPAAVTIDPLAASHFLAASTAS